MNKFIEFYNWMRTNNWHLTPDNQFWLRIKNKNVNPITYDKCTEEELMIKFQAYLNGKHNGK